MSLRSIVDFFSGASVAELVMLALFIGWLAWCAA